MIAVSMGDPTGVGPEVVLKGFSAVPRRVHIGDPDLYARTAHHLAIPIDLREVSSPGAAAELSDHQFAVLPTSARVDKSVFQFGQPHPAHAAAIVESIQTACRLALDRQVSAMVTPPIHKAVLFKAGFRFPGHTELLAQTAGVRHPVMMLAVEEFRVVPATVHRSLASVPGALTQSLLQQVIETVFFSLKRDFGIAKPRVAVTGLNPHAGEDGGFGHEELEIIAPVCQALGKKWPGAVRGPLSADSMFHAQARRSYDAAVCMYHDQALIPIKMLAFGQAVNITLGLPLIRTSVDHGTAFDIAGQGRADPTSFLAALSTAETLAANRQRGTIVG